MFHKQGSKEDLSANPGQVDFLAGQVLPAWWVRVQASYPLTKSLIKTSKKWPQMSKM